MRSCRDSQHDFTVNFIVIVLYIGVLSAVIGLKLNAKNYKKRSIYSNSYGFCIG